MNVVKVPRACCFFLVISFGLGCSLGPTHLSREPRLLSAGYYVGELGLEVVVYGNHDIELLGGRSSGVSRRLSDKSWEQLTAFLGSEAFQHALADLRSGGFKPGCCDVPEVGISFAGEALGFPVCAAPDVTPATRSLIDVVNAIAKETFGRRYSRELLHTSCQKVAPGRG